MSSPVGPSQATQSSSYPGTPDEEFEGYFSNVHAAAEAFILGQGYESVSQDRLRRIMNKDWIKLFKRRGINQTKTLSTKAKECITKDLAAGRYADRENANESALMAPSSDPRDYSHRLTKGSADPVRWVSGWRLLPIHRLDKRLTLAEPERVPKKDLTLFRCDPPALVISIVWHTTRHPFINMFRSHLQGRYSGNEKSVKFMDRSLQHTSGENDERLTGSQAAADAIEFLEANPYAKIVVIIDTHAAENGYFVWAKDANGDYQACLLLEILQDCTPKEIFNYMSDAEDAPSHHHKMLIVNLACGASVSLPQPRSELLTGEVAPVLLPLISDWVQTSSDYDVLIAKSVQAGWAHRNHPVLSRRGHDPSRYTKFTSTEEPHVMASGKDDHILYTRFDLGQPGGRIVRCFRGCEKGIGAKPGKNTVRIKCDGSFRSSTETTLGRFSLVAVAYPQELYPTPHWNPTNTENDQAGPSMLTPAPPPATPTPPPERSTCTSQEPAPPPSPPLQSTLRPPRLDPMVRSISLPSMTSTESTTPMQRRLPTIRIPPRPLRQGSPTIRIPSQPLGQGSLTAVESRRAGTRSATATPPEPQSATTTPPKPQKRPQSKSPEPETEPWMSDLVSRMWQKKRRRGDDHPPTPPMS
ncbi:hypothetical protein BJ322DRAFT_1177906 [Thelephora terrestris]|uniref:Uncharacterized protein n=1 Tax=Thelephora terrestris TaxID=56493 RepID=A0A9P6LA93_9AGAM|nr:hypothetical protein BJ322DRAFT_1177906 [Thelephora terrestris]